MNIKQAIALNRKSGNHYFDEDTMAFWNCKIESELYPHGYFVTSEDNFDRTETLYTVRQFTDNYQHVDTIGTFQAYPHKENARVAARFLSACLDSMIEAGGYRERNIIENLCKIVPFEAKTECYTLIAEDGSSCVYCVDENKFVG